jgi:tetratricopeptide (TPR) repeat protein
MAAEWITQGLSRSLETHVVPGTTVMHLSGLLLSPAGGKPHDDYISQLAEATKSNIVVSGSYYLQGEILQFNAEVQNVKDGSIIYALPARTGSVQQPTEIIEKLGDEIIGGLAFHFGVSDVKFISKPPNINAYSEYIAGMEQYFQNFDETVEHLKRAIKLDSLFFQPYFDLAWAYTELFEWAKSDSISEIINRNREQLSPFDRHRLDILMSHLKGNYTECLHHAIHAWNISPGDWTANYNVGLYASFLNKPGFVIEAYAKFDTPDSYYGSNDVLAWRIITLAQSLHLVGDYWQEIKECRKGQQLYPNGLWLYGDEVAAFAAMGKINEINDIISKCRSISSHWGTFGSVISVAAWELRAHGYDSLSYEYANQAIEWYQHQPTSTDHRRELAYAYYLAGSWQNAKSLYEVLAAESPDNIHYQGSFGTIAAHVGDVEEAIRISEQLSKIDRPYLFGLHTYYRARIASLLGEKEKAVKLLSESFAQGKPNNIEVHNDPDFLPLKGYAPFEELMRPKE